MKVRAWLLTLKNCVNCESVAENRNIDALYKNKAFLQNELTENNKLIKSLIPNYIPKKSYRCNSTIKATTNYSRAEHKGTSISTQQV